MDEQMRAFAEYFNAEMNPESTISQEAIDNMSEFVYRQFISLVKVGFTRQEAMTFMVAIIKTVLSIGMTKKDGEDK